MDRESEIIHGEMEQTRSSLAGKLETLERKVTGTVQEATEVVQDATAAVSNTVETVQDAVQQTVATVKDTVQDAVGTVKEAFNVGRLVERHPWVMFGGAVAIGYLGERLLAGHGRAQLGKNIKSLVQASTHVLANGTAPSDQTNGKHENPRTSTSATSAFGEGVGQFLHAEVNQLKRLAIGTTLGVVRDLVAQSLTKEISEPFANIIDSITRKLGGEPLPAAEQDATQDTAESLQKTVNEEGETNKKLTALAGTGTAEAAELARTW